MVQVKSNSARLKPLLTIDTDTDNLPQVMDCLSDESTETPVRTSHVAHKLQQANETAETPSTSITQNLLTSNFSKNTRWTHTHTRSY